ncbi:hypothetical protein EW146_g8027 [Bondarzewia mesenterica]|uniref:Alpha/beta hydrolase fold-3 domain-containing protein n=1 Tax=Bondarzewia mesenterica TaxID=1095465 RepID=A0A4V3XDY3_9AGAM|nr:hypothetical protein EW146_g8027 [Bondarzewia mesenterica]
MVRTAMPAASLVCVPLQYIYLMVIGALSDSSALGRTCTTALDHLDPSTRKFLNDCDDKTFCSAPLNGTCQRVCADVTRSPLGSGCKAPVEVGEACQFNRDEQCAPSADLEVTRGLADVNNNNGTICLKSTCMYANATLGQSCIYEMTGYTTTEPGGQEFINVVVRDNCRTAQFFCNINTNVCEPLRDVAQQCQYHRDCRSYNCVNNVCEISPNSPLVLATWQYAVTGISIVAAIATTCVMLTFMHKRHRLESYKETRDYCYEQITIDHIQKFGDHLTVTEGIDVKHVWVDPVPHLLTKQMAAWASMAGVEPISIPGYWMDKTDMDTYIGAPPQPGEKVVYVLHGGGYIRLSASPKDPIANIARGLLEHCAPVHRVFAIEYRLSMAHPDPPCNPFPAALVDALAGYVYLIEKVGFQPEDIIVSGDSAGGNLALGLVRYLVESAGWTSTVKTKEGSEGVTVSMPPPPGGVLLFSPLADMSGSDVVPGGSPYKHYDSDYLLPYDHPAAEYVRVAFLGPLYTPESLKNRYISPACDDLDTEESSFKGWPRTLVVAGGAEMFTDQIRKLVRKMGKDMGEGNGEGQVLYHEAPDGAHDFVGLFFHEPERTLAYKVVAKWGLEPSIFRHYLDGRGVWCVPLRMSCVYAASQVMLSGYEFDLPIVVAACLIEFLRRGVKHRELFKVIGKTDDLPVRVEELFEIYNSAPSFGEAHNLEHESTDNLSELLNFYLKHLPDSSTCTFSTHCATVNELFAMGRIHPKNRPSTEAILHRRCGYPIYDRAREGMQIMIAQSLLRLMPTPNFNFLIFFISFLAVGHRRGNGWVFDDLGRRFGCLLIDKNLKYAPNVLWWLLSRWDDISVGLFGREEELCKGDRWLMETLHMKKPDSLRKWKWSVTTMRFSLSPALICCE